MTTEDGDSKMMWKFTKSRMCEDAGVGPLKKAGLVYGDPRAKVNILNEHFCSVFTREDTTSMPTFFETPYPDMM